MALLDFPVSPFNGQVYPTSPAVGQKIYIWDSTTQIWQILGTATGVSEGTYGSSTTVGKFTVNAAGSLTDAQDVLISPLASSVVVSPPVNGAVDLQTLLEDGIFTIKSPNLSVAEGPTGTVTIGLPNTSVSPGTYTGANITVDAQGRITSATNGNAASVRVIAPIVNTGTSSDLIIGILPSSTSQTGAVQLNDTLSSTATDQALTAAQGKNLQDQISALVVGGGVGLNFAGNFSAATAVMETVTTAGTNAGFRVGSNLPAPSPSVNDFFVIISAAGIYIPPGNVTPIDCAIGDWLFCNGTNWVKVNLASKLPSASTTTAGIVRLSTSAETQTGTDGSIAVTPQSLSNRRASEIIEGLTRIATQAEVDAGIDDFAYLTSLKLRNYLTGASGTTGLLPASIINVTPAINGEANLQTLLETGIYDVTSSNLNVVINPTGLVDISLPTTGVTTGTYSYPTITVTAQGTITSVSNGVAPNTTVTPPLRNTGTGAEPVLSVDLASDTQTGVVQLNNTLTSTATNLALTAAQGKILQDQIDILAVGQALVYVGTFDASAGVMESVSRSGADLGFTVGAGLLAASPALDDAFAIVTTPGTYTPPGQTPIVFAQGDWAFCNGVDWVAVEIGPKLPAATDTVAGVVELATDAETQTGTDSTRAVTPAGLSSRTASETNTGLSRIATQAEVDAGTDDANYVTPLKLNTLLNSSIPSISADTVPLNPAVNGYGTVQDALENTLYNLSSSTLSVSINPTGLVTVDLADTGTPTGSFSYPTLTVNSRGQITAISNNTLPAATTLQPGIVQLVDDTVSTATNAALTANQGKNLQDQIDSIVVGGGGTVDGLVLMGTVDGTTSLMASTTLPGAKNGFITGDPVPAATSYPDGTLIIAASAGDVTLSGQTSITVLQADWLVVNLGIWTLVPQGRATSGQYTFQYLDDLSSEFDGVTDTFELRSDGQAFTPTPFTNLQVWLGGVMQCPYIGTFFVRQDTYSISGSTITFVEPPPVGTTFVANSIIPA